MMVDETQIVEEVVEPLIQGHTSDCLCPECLAISKRKAEEEA